MQPLLHSTPSKASECGVSHTRNKVNCPVYESSDVTHDWAVLGSYYHALHERRNRQNAECLTQEQMAEAVVLLDSTAGYQSSTAVRARQQAMTYFAAYCRHYVINPDVIYHGIEEAWEIEGPTIIDPTGINIEIPADMKVTGRFDVREELPVDRSENHCNNNRYYIRDYKTAYPGKEGGKKAVLHDFAKGPGGLQLALYQAAARHLYKRNYEVLVDVCWKETPPKFYLLPCDYLGTYYGERLSEMFRAYMVRIKHNKPNYAACKLLHCNRCWE